MAREGFLARFLRLCVVAACALIAASCGGGSHPPDLVSLAILGVPESALRVGQSLQLTAQGTYSDSSVQDVTAQTTWVSTNPAVLTVTAAGVVTVINAGQAAVIATLPGAATYVELQAVQPPVLVSLSIVGAPATPMQVGQALQLSASGTYSDGSVQDVTAQATWTSTSPGVIVVKAPGLVTAVAPGQAAVIATLAGTMAFVQLEAALPSPPRLALLAGSVAAPGSADGMGDQARFAAPSDVATDAAGNVYVADTGNHTIRRITPAGEVTTLAGSAGQSGKVDGIGAQARFWSPMGIATDSAGHVYVADSKNHAIRKITPAGEVSTFAAVMSVPVHSVAVDSSGTVYVGGVDWTLTPPGGVLKITPAGEVTLLALGAHAAGVATDPAGNVYVANSWPSNTISKMTPEGQVSALAGTAGQSGNADGPGAQARFYNPYDVATDAAGNVYVADTGNNAIRKIDVYGVVTTLAGGHVGTADGSGAAAKFFYPQGVATDRVGNVYVADTYNHTIRKIKPAGQVSTLAGAAFKHGSTDGVGTQALFGGQCNYKVWPGGLFNVSRYCSSFRGVAADLAGNVYVADTYNQTIRKITPKGEVTTLAGVAGESGSADGIGAQARFRSPSAIEADSAGNLYVLDANGIRKVTPAGAVSTVSTQMFSTQTFGYGAWDLTADNAGSLYFADHVQHVIRKLTLAGELTTFAGAPGVYGSADGAGTEARFTHPAGIATDSAGNVYVADSGNYTIRRITPKGEVSTLAGVAGESGSADGVGAQARFSSLDGLAVDKRGIVYVADTGNYTIRKITPAGEVSTVVGVAGHPGFSPGPLPGLIRDFQGLAVSGTSLYIAMSNGVVVVTDLP